jgi:hypothetical protein
VVREKGKIKRRKSKINEINSRTKEKKRNLKWEKNRIWKQ